MERIISLLNNNLHREYKITVFWLTPFSISIDGDGIDCCATSTKIQNMNLR